MADWPGTMKFKEQYGGELSGLFCHTYPRVKLKKLAIQKFQQTQTTKALRKAYSLYAKGQGRGSLAKHKTLRQ